MIAGRVAPGAAVCFVWTFVSLQTRPSQECRRGTLRACATMDSTTLWVCSMSDGRGNGRLRGCCVGAGTGVALCLAAGVVLCENAVHVPKRVTLEASFAHTDKRTVQITASDGAVLRAWLFAPQNSNGNYVIALHGIRIREPA